MFSLLIRVHYWVRVLEILGRYKCSIVFHVKTQVSFLLPFSKQRWWRSHSQPWEESGRVRASGQGSQPASFPGSSNSKESVCNPGDPGSIPGLGRFPGGGHGNLLQHPCLENPMDRGAWWAAVHGVPKSGHIERCSTLPIRDCTGVTSRAEGSAPSQTFPSENSVPLSGFQISFLNTDTSSGGGGVVRVETGPGVASGVGMEGCVYGCRWRHLHRIDLVY